MDQPKRFDPGDRVVIITGKAPGCRGTITADNPGTPCVMVRWDHMKGWPFPPCAVERENLWRLSLLDRLAEAAQ